MPLTNSWGKGHALNKTSALTGVFPTALVINGKVSVGSSTIESPVAGSTVYDYAGSGIYLPFSDLTGLNVASSVAEIGSAVSAKPGPDGDPAATAGLWKEAGAARFMLGVLEAGYAAQQNHASADRLENCVVTRSALSVVDEDTLQKTFTVKFKLNHTSQDVEAE